MTSSEIDALSDACVVNKIKIRFSKNPYKKVEDKIYEQMNAPLILRDNSLICEIDLSKHDIELLDKVANKIREHSGMHYVDCDGYFGGTEELIFKVDDWLDDIIEEMKEVSK